LLQRQRLILAALSAAQSALKAIQVQPEFTPVRGASGAAQVLGRRVVEEGRGGRGGAVPSSVARARAARGARGGGVWRRRGARPGGLS